MSDLLTMVRENRASDLRMFASKLLTKDKGLLKELPTPSFFRCKWQLPKLMFIGGKGRIVSLHYDFIRDEGLLLPLFGRKEVILFPNSASRNLYKLPYNTIFMVNLFEPAYEKYPGLRGIRGYKALMNHGDALYIPSGYYHQLKYVDASISIGFRRWNVSLYTTVSMVIARILQIPTDKLLHIFLGKKWYNWKMDRAYKRAPLHV